eukprot:m51a1_g5540 hypothetical protein (422) ;mRNA; f:471143-481069
MEQQSGQAAVGETVEQFMRRVCDEQVARLHAHGEQKIREFLAASEALAASSAPAAPAPGAPPAQPALVSGLQLAAVIKPSTDEIPSLKAELSQVRQQLADTKAAALEDQRKLNAELVAAFTATQGSTYTHTDRIIKMAQEHEKNLVAVVAALHHNVCTNGAAHLFRAESRNHQQVLATLQQQATEQRQQETTSPVRYRDPKNPVAGMNVRAAARNLRKGQGIEIERGEIEEEAEEAEESAAEPTRTQPQEPSYVVFPNAPYTGREPAAATYAPPIGLPGLSKPGAFPAPMSRPGPSTPTSPREKEADTDKEKEREKRKRRRSSILMRFVGLFKKKSDKDTDSPSPEHAKKAKSSHGSPSAAPARSPPAAAAATSRPPPASAPATPTAPQSGPRAPPAQQAEPAFVPRPGRRPPPNRMNNLS